MKATMGTAGFDAQYPGFCTACLDDIVPGQRVQYVNDMVRHVDCDAAAASVMPETRNQDICERCFQARAANGACGCDA